MRNETLQLGMDYGTAQNRLKKMVFFSMLQAIEIDVCIRCGQKLTVGDFSLDHKEQWLGNPDLFWDLTNIGFSHNKCNQKARKPREIDVTLAMMSHLYKIRLDRRKSAPEGQAWCGKHLDYLPKENFGKDKKQANGLHFYCRECRGKLKY
jgi:hypothetical protein